MTTSDEYGIKAGEIFEPSPRWPGAPPFCIAAQRLAFDSKKAVSDYIARYCPGVAVQEHYECVKCGLIHFEGIARPPSGWSSGAGRKLLGQP